MLSERERVAVRIESREAAGLAAVAQVPPGGMQEGCAADAGVSARRARRHHEQIRPTGDNSAVRLPVALEARL